MPKHLQTFDDAVRKLAKTKGAGVAKRTQTTVGGDSGIAGGQKFVNPMGEIGQMIAGGEGGALEQVPAGTEGQLLAMVDVAGDLKPRFRAFVDIAEQAAPATPPAGFVRVYAKSDKKLYAKDSDGTETALW